MILFEALFNDTTMWHHHCREYPADGKPVSDKEVGNIFAPSEFDFLAFRHGMPVAHDPDNLVGWAQPEGHHESIAQFPDRIDEGFAVWMAFGFYKIIDTALVKKLTVPSKGKLTITVRAHAWSSTNDISNASDGVGTSAYNVTEGTPGLSDAQRNVTFWTGIGSDPFNGIYSEGRHIYNKYSTVSGTFDVEAGETYVFARAKALYPFKHNNVYFDSFVVTFEPDAEQPTPEPCKGYPREKYNRTVLLMHPTANGDWIKAVIDSGTWDAMRVTIGGSADDAGIGALDYRRVLAVRPSDWPSDLSVFFDTYYPGVIYIPIEVETPDQLRAWLVDWLGAQNPTLPPSGGSQSLLAPGLHLNVGDSGATDYYKRLRVDLGERVAPSIKAYGSPETMATLKLFKDIDERILTVGRLSHGVNGEDIEGISLEGDLLKEAQRIMTILMTAASAHRTYVDVWEIINEQDPVGVDGHRKMAIFFMHCMDIANANNYKIALFSYSLGVPEWDEIVAIAQTGCLAQAKRDGHYIALHEYADPLDKDFGEAIPGTPQNDARGPFALRYRYWQDAVGGAENMPNVLLTEVNIAHDLRTVNAASWDEQIRWYMTEVSKDQYVKAVHLFGWGSFASAWPDYDVKLAGLADRWYQIVLDFQDEATTPPAQYIPFSQRTPPWSTVKLGTSAHTMYSSGCLVTSYASLFTLTDQAFDPLKLVTWLNANNGFTADGSLYVSKPFEMENVKQYWKYVNYHTWRDAGEEADMAIVRRLLAYGPTILQVDFVPGTSELNSHFVLALREIDGDIEIMDPWTGLVCKLLETYGSTRTLAQSIFAAIEYQRITPEPTNTLIGFNDHPNASGSGADWMRANNVKGIILRPIFLGGSASALDFSKEAVAGIKVIVNLRYSYSTDMGGAGTIPKPDSPEWYTFVIACANTINTSVGVWGWELFNEANNPREWPLSFTLRPEHISDTYNAIRELVIPAKRVMAPGALDPFNAVAGDPRSWLTYIYNSITGAEFVPVHAYIRGPQPDLVNSTAKFTDEPLTWQYLNYYRCIDALLEALPVAYKDLDVYVTEFNHLWKTNEAVGDIGWVNDSRAASVVNAAYTAARLRGYKGLCLYRWSGDEWHLYDNSFVLNAVLVLSL